MRNKFTRREHWHKHLTTAINDARRLPFVWGTHDCYQWAAFCILAVTGTDIAEHSRGTYSTAIGGIKAMLKLHNCHQLSELMGSFFQRRHIAFARPGDIVFKLSNYEGYDLMLGVCNGAKSFFVLDEDGGLEMQDTLDQDGCYKIG